MVITLSNRAVVVNEGGQVTVKDGLYVEGQLTSRKNPRCHVIKENEAKKKNFLMWGGGTRWQPKASSPLPKWWIQDLRNKKVVKSGRFWVNQRVHHMVVDHMSQSPDYARI